MATIFQRPKDKTEKEDREVAGLWLAIRLAKQIGESSQQISLGTILEIHKLVFQGVNPEMAGRFRRNGEDVEALECVAPPPGRLTEEFMQRFSRDFDARISVIPRHPNNQSDNQRKKWFASVIGLAAWTQYQLVAIHPFCDGNGRVARLATNLVLARFGLPPSRVKYEGEHKAAYLNALCQIDKAADYELLQKMIAENVITAYQKEQKIRARAVDLHGRN